MRSLSELIASLRSLSSPVRPGRTGSVPAAFRANPKPVEGYVSPDLSVVENVGAARVVLIEAIGAVGKTAASLEMASNRNWPLIDSSKAQVGAYSLSGMLHDALGVDSTFIQDLAQGRAGLIVDGLDEAHLRVGTSNFVAFIDNVIQLTDPAVGNSVSVVLMSRPDTAEYVRMRFAEMGRELGVMKIDFFSLEKAQVFVMSQLRALATQRGGPLLASIGSHAVAYQQLRDKRLLQVASSLCGSQIDDLSKVWAEHSGFLGYAPVLSVLAESIAIANPHKELTGTLSASDSSTEILLALVLTILEREQEKFSNQALAPLVAKSPADCDWSDVVVYSPREQVDRVLAYCRAEPLTDPLPVALPDSSRGEYESMADQFVADHPFLDERKPVNVVFSDYLDANSICDPARDLRHPEFDFRKDVGPFFFRFVHRIASDQQGDIVPQIPESLVPTLIRSLAKTIDRTDLTYWLFAQASEQATLELFDSSTGEFLVFDVCELSGMLELEQVARLGTVLTDESISITGRGGLVHLGPHLFVAAREIFIEADSVKVESSRSGDGQPTRLIAERIESPKLKSIEAHGSDSFEISSPELHPILRGHSRELGSTSFIAYSSFVNIRAILRFFRRTVHSVDPVIRCDHMDHRIIGANPSRAKLLTSLLENDIVRRNGEFYILNSEQLAAYGLSFNALNAGEPSREMLALLHHLTTSGDSEPEGQKR